MIDMELKEDQDGWTISFKDGRVQLIQIDLIGYCFTNRNEIYNNKVKSA